LFVENYRSIFPRRGSWIIRERRLAVCSAFYLFVQEIHAEARWQKQF
jgi:hypothetical protein